MRKPILACVIGLTLVSGSQALAGITVIDFESLASHEVVDDQFLGLGADFNASAGALSLSKGTLDPDYPPYSGDKLISDAPFSGTGIIRIDAVGSPWSMAGGYVTGSASVTLTAYASDSSVLGTASTGGANRVSDLAGLLPNIFLSVSAPNIAHVEFSDTGNEYTVDDFSYQPIPAPGAILLGSIGIGLVGWMRKHRAF